MGFHQNCAQGQCHIQLNLHGHHLKFHQILAPDVLIQQF